MEFYKKYSHVGYSFLGVPDSWKPVVKNAVIKIEKEMWKPSWLPLFLKRWIHQLARGKSVVNIRNQSFYNLRNKLTKGMMITDIKTKYANLCIYGHFNDEIEKIIENAEVECSKICEFCGSKENVTTRDLGWIYNLCEKCYSEKLKK